jgi:DtxR family transcriptional regulator, Mn-dependent transcriptional regulator
MMNNEFHTVRGYQLLEQNKVLLTSAMEDYLEMIYRNSLEEGYLRINRLAELLNVRASSATKMVQRLGELGLLNYKKYGIVMLSDIGQEIGGFLLERHRITEGFLKLLGCEEDLLQQTELIEHSINARTVKKINVLNLFFKKHPDILERYLDFQKKVEESK